MEEVRDSLPPPINQSHLHSLRLTREEATVGDGCCCGIGADIGKSRLCSSGVYKTVFLQSADCHSWVGIGLDGVGWREGKGCVGSTSGACL